MCFRYVPAKQWPPCHLVLTCSVLQCVVVHCSELQWVAVSCSELQCVAMCCGDLESRSRDETTPMRTCDDTVPEVVRKRVLSVGQGTMRLCNRAPSLRKQSPIFTKNRMVRSNLKLGSQEAPGLTPVAGSIFGHFPRLIFLKVSWSLNLAENRIKWHGFKKTR